MRRAVTHFGIAATVSVASALAGCSSAPPTSAAPTTSAAATSSSATGTSTPSSSVVTSSSGPGDQVDGDAYESKLLTANDIPPAYTKKRASAQDAYQELQQTAQNAQVTPPGCAGVSALTPQTVAAGRLAAFQDSATRELIVEFLAPAGSPSLDDLRAQATTCATANLEVPEKGISTTATIAMSSTPPVAADATLGLTSTVITTTAGSPAITVRQTVYFAEVKGILVSLTASGGPSGDPVDQAVVGATFTKAVDRVNAG